MVAALNPNYQPPSRDLLSNTLVPAWYKVERERVNEELREVKEVALTSDGWTSVAQDHYLSVTAHFIKSGSGRVTDRVLQTKPVYQAQTGVNVAAEISLILEEFHIKEKVVVITMDNAMNMDVAARIMNYIKLPCFAHCLNLAAQKLYTDQKYCQVGCPNPHSGSVAEESSLGKTSPQREATPPKYVSIIIFNKKELYLYVDKYPS